MKTAICAIIRDEHEHIAEWLDWSLSHGFDEIWLYEDFGSKSHKEITDKYDKVHLNTVEGIPSIKVIDPRYKGCSRQCTLYQYFIDNNPADCDWCAFIDVDEYIDFEDDWSMERLLKTYKDEPAIYLTWKIITASGHISKPEGGLVKNYHNVLDNRYICPQEKDFKTLVNMRNHKEFYNMHECSVGGVNTLGIHNEQLRTWKYAWLNHYFTKSWEEWLWRFTSKNEFEWGIRMPAHFFWYNPEMMHLKDELMKQVESLGLPTDDAMNSPKYND